MGMFDNYDSLADNYSPKYVPNNIRPTQPTPCGIPSKLDPCEPNKPYVDYNAMGQIQGYWWHYGDTVNLEFNISGEATYESDTSEEVNSDASISPLQVGQYLLPDDFFKDKTIQVQLYNFRQEEMVIDKQLLMKTYGYDDLIINEDKSATVIFVIDKDISKKLVKGVYYITLKVLSDDYQDTLFGTADATLTVK